jgi:hypothetical protein
LTDLAEAPTSFVAESSRPTKRVSGIIVVGLVGATIVDEWIPGFPLHDYSGTAASILAVLLGLQIVWYGLRKSVPIIILAIIVAVYIVRSPKRNRHVRWLTGRRC